jgi:CheY-like chemotaxis protein
VVVDIRMPPGNTTEGLEAAKVIRAEREDLSVVTFLEAR